MIGTARARIPELFCWLTELGCLNEPKIYSTSDGFYAAAISLADMLAHRGITVVPDSRGEELECRLYFDDWYLYAVENGSDHTYSLFKMREQEYDARQGLKADGDTPGVTIPFIALQPYILRDCLSRPTVQNRAELNREINRVVASRGQRHDDILKEYFIRTQAQGPYLVAKLYARHIASFAQDGCLPVPECYGAGGGKQRTQGRVPRFIEENNAAAGRVICDHETLFLRDPERLTHHEQLAILATHTGNVSLYSFAAEVQYHAKFLMPWAKIPIPFTGKTPYESAIRADLSIGDAEFTGPTPYYRLNSTLVKRQCECHKNETEEEWGL